MVVVGIASFALWTALEFLFNSDKMRALEANAAIFRDENKSVVGSGVKKRYYMRSK